MPDPQIVTLRANDLVYSLGQQQLELLQLRSQISALTEALAEAREDLERARQLVHPAPRDPHQSHDVFERCVSP